MFGYVTVNRPELKVKDLEIYEAFYCGVCRQIRKRNGLFAAGVLNYDMTFLAILLASLYEEEVKSRKNHCILHPFGHRVLAETPSCGYAADMNFMLAYHNRMDDWLDEKDLFARITVSFYHQRYKKLAAVYPRQHKAMIRYVKELHRIEKSRRNDPEAAATLTGKMMQEIYVREEDLWAPALREMGFYMGKFIYLMDAYEDVEKDRKTRNYNPFLSFTDQKELEKKAQEYLKLMLGGCCRAFETLPLLEYTDLMRNILYSGVWAGFQRVTEKRNGNAGERKTDHGSI